MKVVSDRFRCDLCGKFRNAGVTETRPIEGDDGGEGSTTNTVCAPCVTQAQHLLAAAGLEADG